MVGHFAALQRGVESMVPGCKAYSSDKSGKHAQGSTPRNVAFGLESHGGIQLEQ